MTSRTLKDEFLSVFTEANSVLEGLAKAEAALESSSEDPDEMQAAIENMATLQSEADRLDA